MASLYAASLSVDLSTLGANRVLTVSVSGLRDEYALAEEALSAQYAALALSVAFMPSMADGVIDPEAIAIEKEQLREILKNEINDKRGHCLRQARRAFFAGEPEGVERLGYLDEVDALTPEAVTAAFWHILQTARIEVMALGMNADDVIPDMCACLNELPRTPQDFLPPRAMPRTDAPSVTAEPMDTVQGKLCLLYTAGETLTEEELPALRVAQALLGGMPTSRLFTNVREKRSLCYYCAASITSRTAMLCIDSGIEHENAGTARAAIEQELAALQRENATDAELAETKRYLRTALNSVEDTLGGLEAWYFNELARGSDKTPQQSIALIDAVTPDEVRAALQKFTLRTVHIITKGGA